MYWNLKDFRWVFQFRMWRVWEKHCEFIDQNCRFWSFWYMNSWCSELSDELSNSFYNCRSWMIPHPRSLDITDPTTTTLILTTQSCYHAPPTVHEILQYLDNNHNDNDNPATPVLFCFVCLFFKGEFRAKWDSDLHFFEFITK